MAFHRVVVVAVATLFSIGMTSIASACCDWGYSSPVAYAAVAPVGFGGCGTCGVPTAAAVFAQPVAPAPIYITPVVATAFGGPCCAWSGCGNCGWSGWSGGRAWGGCGACGQAAVYAAPSLYVVNQGPVYSGPGIMAPYQTYSPETAYAPATDYPYVPGYGNGYGYGYGYGYGRAAYPHYYAHPYYRARYAYRAPIAMHPYMHPYMRPRYYGPAPRYYRGAAYWRR